MHSTRAVHLLWKSNFDKLAFLKQTVIFTNLKMLSSTSTNPLDGEALLSLIARKGCVQQEADFRPVTASQSEHHSLIIREPNQPTHPRRLKVAVLGMPNAGKSTLINSVLGKRIMATSERIDTTIDNCLAVSTVGDTQIIFQDTPGIISKSKATRHRISPERLSQPTDSFFDADLGIIMADLTARRVKDGYLQPEILLTMLKNQHVPTVLVLNKVDKYKNKEHLLVLIHQLTAGHVSGVPFEPKKIELVPMRFPKVTETLLQNYDELDLMNQEDVEKRLERSESSFLNKLRHYRGWPHFQDVFVTSAKEGKGLTALRNYMLRVARPGPWQYHSDVVTDASPKQVIMDSVRAGLLQNLPEEVPYHVFPQVTEWKELEDGRLLVDIEVLCGKKSHFNCVARKSRRIAKETQEQLQDAFFLEVFVQVMPVFVKGIKL